jgi:hypothetical protein
MKKLLIAGLSVMMLAFGLYSGFRWVVPKWERSVVAGKMPRTAIATVVKREPIHLNDDQPFVLPNGSYVVGVSNVFLVYYRLDDFQGISDVEREAVLRGETKRYARDGPRVESVEKSEYDSLEVGAPITVKYAYYPSVLWGVSDSIRVPW